MKKLLLLLLFPLPLFAQSAVIFNWTSDGNPTMPECSATVTTSCKTVLGISDITSPSSPIVINNSISDSVLTYSLMPLPSVGSHTYSLTVFGKDQSGNAITGTPVTATVAVPSIVLNPPQGFSVAP